MVSYRKRGNAWQYEISYKDLDGKYKKLRKSGYHFKSDAEQAASEVRTQYLDVRQYKAGEITLSAYFNRWIKLYKLDSVSDVTLIKYQNTLQHIRRLFGKLKLKDISRPIYQEKINEFAQTHAPRTVATFHKQIRAALLDALDEKIISTDPTRKTIVTGTAMPTKLKALSFSEWRKLITHLNFHDNSEMIIYLGAVTGMRYAEILGLTKCDLNAVDKTINVNKTWDYKYRTGFKKTKNAASVRTISISSTTVQRLHTFIASKRLGPDDPLFLNNGKAPVSADINKTLTNILQKLGLPRITFHGLRHTHASVLLYQGVSVLSVSRRLGHSSITTTQSTYLHVIKELEQQDNDKIISILGDL